jgi:hypothetical protein
MPGLQEERDFNWNLWIRLKNRTTRGEEKARISAIQA